MVKPPATNMTITLQQRGDNLVSVKPLVVGEQVVVHTNATHAPILPHQPVASEQDHKPEVTESLLAQAGLTLEKKLSDSDRLRDFTQEQIALLSNRYHFTRQN
jgi:hypothetical protein